MSSENLVSTGNIPELSDKVLDHEGREVLDMRAYQDIGLMTKSGSAEALERFQSSLGLANPLGIQARTLLVNLQNVWRSGAHADQQKKMFFYGTDPLAAMEKHARDMENQYRPCDKEELIHFLSLSPRNVDLFHAIVGLATEVSEIINALFGCAKESTIPGNTEISEKLSRNIAEELGDILWYVNLLSASVNQSIPEIALRNARKLLTRYHQKKFDQAQADNRDLAREEAALDGNSKDVEASEE